MAKQRQQQQDDDQDQEFHDPYGLRPDQQESLVRLGRLMGSPLDEFDRQVQELHDKRFAHEHEAEKMRAAQTGRASQLGESDIEKEQT